MSFDTVLDAYAKDRPTIASLIAQLDPRSLQTDPSEGKLYVHADAGNLTWYLKNVAGTASCDPSLAIVAVYPSLPVSVEPGQQGRFSMRFREGGKAMALDIYGEGDVDINHVRFASDAGEVAGGSLNETFLGSWHAKEMDKSNSGQSGTPASE
ncbi:hypothetical protein AAF712_011962 [Marasmius tenuissimus]|uniref:Uncharacterized protein n=1 Tax=Marasmius tenuissimus TaxID=585030 RepID=A0ABR2ZKF2_9AGAR